MGLPFGNFKKWLEHDLPIDCKWPIAAEPIQAFLTERSRDRPHCSSGNHVRFASYNILADMYCSSDAAKNIIFRHCPVEFLKHGYRLPLILRELLSYKADFLCLQEVDQQVFYSYLKPALWYTAKMCGIFLSKREMIDEANDPSDLCADVNRAKGEGCAIFYSEDRFKFIQEYHLPSILTHARQDPHIKRIFDQVTPDTMASCKSDVPDIFRRTFAMDRRKAHSHCLMVALFQWVKSPDKLDETADRLLLVGNTHFYFSPSADNWRYVQACTVREHLNSVALQVYMEKKVPIDLVFCADINQSPKGPAHEALLEKPEISSPLSLQLKSAYVLVPNEFTNWVPGFQGALDVILYSADTGFKCLQTLPLWSKEQITKSLQGCAVQPTTPRGEPIAEQDLYALPNAQFPSDHLCLVADFEWSSN